MFNIMLFKSFVLKYRQRGDSMSLMLERNVYRGCNYVIKKQFNYYNILCTNNNCYLNYEKVRKDILEETTSIKNLGKRLLFLLCNIESFDSLLKKDRK